MIKWDPIWVANTPTLYFVYGLAFFLLGFAVVLQQKKSSKLKLAQPLSWLALFAIIHGLAEWGYLFIPLNEPYLSAEAVQRLIIIQLALWVLSFIFLFCFGLALFRPELIGMHRGPLIGLISAVVFSLWLVDYSINFSSKNNEIEILSRYLLCLPGSLLVAVGLYKQRGELERLGSKTLLRYLNLAVISFAGYAFAGGLIVPEASFFPANELNSVNFRNYVGVPIELMRAGLGALMALSISKVLRVFDLEDQNREAEIKRRETLALERERISRDLHDGVIQSIYASALTLQKLKKVGCKGEHSKELFEEVLLQLDSVVTDIRMYVQDLQPTENADEISTAVGQLEKAFSLPVEVIYDQGNLVRLTPEARDHIRLIIREGLANIAKHAQAQKAVVRMEEQKGGLLIEIKDDGKGLSAGSQQVAGEGQKFGLKNLKARSAALNGYYNIDFTDSGTTLHVWLPWEGNSIG